MVRRVNEGAGWRLQADREELVERIARLVRTDGSVEVRAGLFLNRISDAGHAVHGVFEPSFCVIAQGRKEIILGGERFRYDPAHYLITTMELPAIGKVIEASRAQPYLGLRLVLDPAVVTSVLVESGAMPVRADGGGVKALDVSALGAEMLNATLRLVRLADSPNEYRMLSPLVIREIVYRLLTGDQVNRLHHLATFGGHDHRIVRAVKRLSEEFAKQVRIDEMARELNMSVSGFHARFKAITAMSPLQYQKRLRLQEARRLMLSENLDAGEAGYRVGYEDQSHFSREYKRQFGEPPMRDVERLREMVGS